jgi:hypothetical protein
VDKIQDHPLLKKPWHLRLMKNKKNNHKYDKQNSKFKKKKKKPNSSSKARGAGSGATNATFVINGRLFGGNGGSNGNISPLPMES